MKLKDSDLIQQYNATRRSKTASGADDIIIFGGNDFLPKAQPKPEYTRLVEDIGDSLVSADQFLNAKETIKALKEAIQTQLDYHKDGLEYYQGLMDQLK